MTARARPRRTVDRCRGGASTDDAWTDLVRDLRTRVAAYAPDWTNETDSDPGITIVELMAFLGESLLTRTVPPVRAVSRLREVVTKLERGASPPCDDLANPTRPRYLEGRLITAADLTQEQEYHRTKRRRHNLLLHGTGLVSGLDVAVESGSTGEPVVSVSPGVAISPDGEELLVCERMMSPVTVATPLAYVALRLADRPHAMIPTSGGDEASRIEEVVEVHVVTELATSDLGIARVVRREDSWRVDPTFNVPRGAAR